jgi:hypothetical protein
MRPTGRRGALRARALARRGVAAAGRGLHWRSASPAGLVFLRGRDADARLRELAAARAAARPLLGALAAELLRRGLVEALGYRSLGDFARERLGVGARAVREWARVHERLAELPRLREAVLAGEVSWAVARAVAGLATPDTEAACLETVRGRTVRAVLVIVAAVRASEASGAAAGDLEAAGDAADEEAERVRVRLGASEREARRWYAAVELARRVAGEELPVWQCAEWIAAEAASAIGGPEAGSERELNGPGRVAASVAAQAAEAEHGLRHRAFPGLRWTPLAGALPGELAALAAELPAQGPREVERRLGAAVAFLQSLDFETGRILGQLRERRLHGELGFESFGRYARERLDLAPRTARRLVALARAKERAPAVATAFRTGRIHAFQAHALVRVADPSSAAAWVARARAVSLRRLLDEVDLVPRREIAFLAPPEVARFFLGMLARAGSLERLLAHAIASWAEMGRQFRDYADFERDGFRCTVPGCTGRRNLHSHHVRYRSRQGPDAPWNRTTLCAHHHQRGQHGGTLRIRGRAPDALVYELGIRTGAPERFRSGDVRIGSREP